MSDALADKWYYTGTGDQRLGPVDGTAIRDMIARKALSGSELVWTAAFGPDWKPLATTQLWLDQGEAPPLPVSSINPTFVWLLAVVPLISAIVEAIVVEAMIENGAHPTQKGIFWAVTILTALANTLLASADANLIKRSGNAAPSLGWAFFLVPVYLWQRSSKLRLNQAPFIVWLVMLVVSIAIG